MKTNSIHLNRFKQGSALLMVLIIVLVLTLLVMGFSTLMKNEIQALSTHYEEAQSFQLARSAVALARLELTRRSTTPYSDGYGNLFFVKGNKDYEAAIDELKTYRKGYKIGSGYAAYQLINIPNALDPNKLSTEGWHRLLETACGIEEGEERNELVDAFQDWIDKDNATRANGAEEEFYQTLNPPRHVKNAPIVQLEEILLITGFTPDMFYGNNALEIKDGLVIGGGLLHYFMGDNSPEGAASKKYILSGTLPPDSSFTFDKEEEMRFKRLNKKPEHLYLVAQGFLSQDMEQEEQSLQDQNEDPTSTPIYQARHIILIRLGFSKKKRSYQIEELFENASGELLNRILTHQQSQNERFDYD